MITAPIVSAMLEETQKSLDNLKDSIQNVKLAGFNNEYTEQRISFEIVEGKVFKPGKFIGALRGRNEDLVIGFSEECDKGIAARVLADGHTWKDNSK